MQSERYVITVSLLWSPVPGNYVTACRKYLSISILNHHIRRRIFDNSKHQLHFSSKL